MDSLKLVPLYTQREASDLIGMPQQTFSRWASGYETRSGNRKPGFITLDRPGQGFTVPFIGLAEAWVVRAFVAAGLPVRKIRPALEKIRESIGIEHVLASDRLATDGVEVLVKEQDRDSSLKDTRLIVARNGQAVFGEVVSEHLKTLQYTDGFVGSMTIPRGNGADFTINPYVNFGQPTLAEYGVRVVDIVDRVRAGESIDDVAHDYSIPDKTVSNLVLTAA